MINYMYLANTLSILKSSESREDRNISLIVWLCICIFFIILFILLGVLLHHTWFLIIGIIFSYIMLIYLINYCVTDNKTEKKIIELKS